MIRRLRQLAVLTREERYGPLVGRLTAREQEIAELIAHAKDIARTCRSARRDGVDERARAHQDWADHAAFRPVRRYGDPCGKILGQINGELYDSRCGLSLSFDSALSAFGAGSQPSSETSRVAVGRFLHRQLHTPRWGQRSGCHSQQLYLAVREVRRYSGVLSEPLGR